MLKNKVALIVEDNAINLIAIKGILDKLDMRFKRNTSGAQVVEQAQKMLPDVILLDMDLPYGNSLAIYDALKHAQDLQDIPVIALAENSLPQEVMTEIATRDFAGRIPKPFVEKDVRQTLQKVFKNGQRKS